MISTSPATPLTSANGRPRLEVIDLTVSLRGDDATTMVENISFAVRAGDILGLVGESGSGKTTVSLALLGHARRELVIRSGVVRLDGIDLLSLGPRELRAMRGAAVAYVPQDPSAALNPALRIGTQLREALTVHTGTIDEPRARINDVLNEVRLEATDELLRRYPHQLSGGQQQRVAIAMAFSCRPSLIVLDEPTTGLDVSTQRHVLDTVRKLCHAYGVAAVYVSHDLAVVAGLVSEVAVMYAGRIIERGPATHVLNDPVHPYTRGLIAAVPSPDIAEVLTGVEGQPPRPGAHPTGCSFAPRCRYGVLRCTESEPQAEDVADRLVWCFRAKDIHRECQQAREVLATRESQGHCPAAGLTVQALSASYGTTRVLEDITFDIEPESCTAVVGESGSGKTTLARCIVGMHDNWTGTIAYEGEILARRARQRPSKLLRDIQYIFQNPYTSLNPRRTIGQIVAQPLEHFTTMSRSERTARVDATLDDVALSPSVKSRYPDQLSGGERQRVAIARALIVQPRLLVCDEVTSALDVSVQAVIIELLRALQHERRLSMIFVTHNIGLVRSIAQHAIVLRTGRVVEAGPVDAVLSAPTDPYTIQLMIDVPRVT